MKDKLKKRCAISVGTGLRDQALCFLTGVWLSTRPNNTPSWADSLCCYVIVGEWEVFEIL